MSLELFAAIVDRIQQFSVPPPLLQRGRMLAARRRFKRGRTKERRWYARREPLAAPGKTPLWSRRTKMSRKPTRDQHEVMENAFESEAGPQYNLWFGRNGRGRVGYLGNPQ